LFHGATIHAFEPSPDCLAVLKQKQWGDTISIHPMALGSKLEENVFHRYELSVLNSILPLERGGSHQFSDVEEVGQTRVKTDTLDNVSKNLGVSFIDLLKIDTQGFDHQVLLGARGLLAQGGIQVVMVELNFISIYQRQSSALDIQVLLDGFGFKLVDFYEKFRSGNSLAWCTAVFAQAD
ncbi:MAG TPA: FkbM family methyltransferase, partial [Prosthecobacter sp.]